MIKFSKKIYNFEKVTWKVNPRDRSSRPRTATGRTDRRERNLDMHLNKIRDESKLKREWMKMGLHGETKLYQGP